MKYANYKIPRWNFLYKRRKKIFAEAEKYSQVEEQFNEATQQWEVVKYF